MTSLFEALPAEIILQIHLVSTSSSLPYVSRYIHSVIQSSSTPSYRARWLLRRLAREGYTPAPSPRTRSSTAGHDTSDHHANLQARLIRRRIPRGIKSRPYTSGSVEWQNNEQALSTSSTPVATEHIDASFLSKALKFPICNLDTILLLQEKCLNNLNDRLQAKYEESQQARRSSANGSTTNRVNAKRHKAGLRINVSGNSASISDTSPPPPPYPKFLPLPPKTIDIPKRLFRNLNSSPSLNESSPLFSDAPTSANIPPSSSSVSSLSLSATTTFETQDLPLLLHILINLQGNPNSNKGYALAKSVLCRNLFLIEILLEYGADPCIKDYMAVMLAIGRKDLEIVKLLVEYQKSDSMLILPQNMRGESSNSSPSVDNGESDTLKDTLLQNSTGTSRKRKRGNQDSTVDSSSVATTRSSISPPKRRRIEDRIQVTSEMLELAVKLEYEPLIQFFMSKGAVPNLKTLQMLQM